MTVTRKHIDNTILHRENTFVKQIFETMNQSFGGGECRYIDLFALRNRLSLVECLLVYVLVIECILVIE